MKFWTDAYVRGLGWMWQAINISHFDWFTTDNIPTFQSYVLKDLCRMWKEAGGDQFCET